MKVEAINQFSYQMATPEDSHKHASVTVPDQGFTIDDLLKRHEMGLLTDIDFPDRGVFLPNASLDDPDMEEVNRMDVIDRSDFLQAGKTALEYARKKDADSVAAAAAAAEEARIEALVVARMKAKAEPS